jgi:hypothetical protein
MCPAHKVGADIASTKRSAVKASCNSCLIITEGDIAHKSLLPHHGQILRIDHTWAHKGQRPQSTVLAAAAAYPSHPIHICGLHTGQDFKFELDSLRPGIRHEEFNCCKDESGVTEEKVRNILRLPPEF